MNKGIEYYQLAIGKDPTYALAYAGLSDSYTSAAVFGFVAPNEVFPRAKEAALKALEIDDTLAEAHTSLAFVKSHYEWDWPGAEREFQRAIALNPSSAFAHYFYSVMLRKTGRFDQAITEGNRAVELDPLLLTSNTILGTTFHMARQYDQAIEQMRKTLELDPNFPLAHCGLGMAYVQKSMYREGIAEFERGLVISPGYPIALSGLGYAYAVAGEKAEAQKMLDQLNEISKQKYVPALYRVGIYVGLGEKDKAFEWLEKSYADHSIGVGFGTPKVDPMFDPLRSDPRFQSLLRQINLQP